MLNNVQFSNKTNNLPKKFVSVFDIIPKRLTYDVTNIFTIINSEYMNKFINDILDVSCELELDIVHKIKRKIDFKTDS